MSGNRCGKVEMGEMSIRAAATSLLRERRAAGSAEIGAGRKYSAFDVHPRPINPSRLLCDLSNRQVGGNHQKLELRCKNGTPG